MYFHQRVLFYPQLPFDKLMPKNHGEKAHVRRAGMRFSVLDAVVLFLAAVGTVWLRSLDVAVWWLVPMVVGHFFLFCNVFLVYRNLELLWAAVFVLNAGYHVWSGNFSWWPVCGWQLIMTVIVICWQIRSPWYHGVGAKMLNPHIESYLNGSLK